MKVKKFILSCVAVFAVSSVCAQGPDYTQWYVQGHVGGQYTLGESSFGKLMSPNVLLGGGYTFNDLYGARFSLNAWQSCAGQADQAWNWKYVAPSIDGTFNITNYFGFDQPRLPIDILAIAGFGLNIAFDNDQAATANENLRTFYSKDGNYPGDVLEDIWTGTKAFLNFHFGLAGDYRFNDRWSVGIEVQSVAISDKYNSKKGTNLDWYFNATAGVKYFFND